MPSRLIVHSPSPSTVSYTVSNAPPRSTITAKLIFGLEIILRISIFTFILLIDAAKLRDHVLDDDGIIPWADLWASKVGSVACNIADGHIWHVVAGCSAALLYLVLRKGYTEESLLVIKGLGIQTSTSSATYLPGATTRFIPTTQIQDIVIHEAFRGFEVIFYLAVIVEGEPDVVVVFPNLLPRRLILEEVWKGARKCLYKPTTNPAEKNCLPR